MRLELASFQVKDIAFGNRTELANGTLIIDKESLRHQVLQDSWFNDADIHLVHPYESVRIINAVDVIQPRFKVEGPGTVFPGFIGPPVTVGQGKTTSLAGTAMTIVCEPVPGEGTYWREAIIEISGPGAPACPFSGLQNIVLELKPNLDRFPKDGESEKVLWRTRSVHQFYLAVAKASFRAAASLAEAARNKRPSQVEAFELTPCDPSLLRVAFVYQNLSASLYGAPAVSPSGTIIHPNESIDGAVINFSTMGTSFHHPNYLEQNNEIVTELYRHHGKDLNFVGYVIYGDMGNTSTIEEKERVSSAAANLTRLLGAQAMITVGQNDSNLCIDYMMTVQKCERMGIKSTLIYKEVGTGPDDPGFIFSVPEADAIVCVGSREQPLTLPPVNRLIGGTHLISDGSDAKGEINVTNGLILGANNLLALNRLTTRLR